MRALALILALFVAGCTSDERPSEAAVAAPEENVDRAALTNESASLAPVPRSFSFEYEGTTGLWGCWPSGPGSCVGGPGVPPENTFQMQHHQGTPLGVNVTVTWSAASPLTDELSLRIVTAYKDGSQWAGWQTRLVVNGTSPLQVSAFDLGVAANESFGIGIGYPPKTPPPPPGYIMEYALPQDFAVEGEVVALVPQR